MNTIIICLTVIICSAIICVTIYYCMFISNPELPKRLHWMNVDTIAIKRICDEINEKLNNKKK